MTEPKTLHEKIWETHVAVTTKERGATVYIDRHFVHEVTSAQAFEGLELSQRSVACPECTIVVPDHNVPTTSDRLREVRDLASRDQLAALEENVSKFGLPNYYPMSDHRQGIVHVVGPEQGWTLPGLTIACGDSHTSTHGAFGALAFGIGTSEVEHVLATQTLLKNKERDMKVELLGSLRLGATSKDVALHLISVLGTSGAMGYVIEYTGEGVRSLSMEARMTLCNMAVEAGASAGLVAPDSTTLAYLKGRPHSPVDYMWDKAVEYWDTLRSDPTASFDRVIEISLDDVAPTVTWGTSPEHVLPITASVPHPDEFAGGQASAVSQALAYMGLTPGAKLTDIEIDAVFIGSCTNGRIEDLREAASILRDRKLHQRVKAAIVVPGSGLVKLQAEQEGLDRIFIAAGFEWRLAGCSMCLGMNPDQLDPGVRCAATSNRNFEGRQGPGARTHLMSPLMAAAAAVAGRLIDVRDLVDTERVISPDAQGQLPKDGETEFINI